MTDDVQDIDQEVETIDPAIEEEAKAQGWTSKEDYAASGKDPSTWRSASDFLEYGKNSQYILRKNVENLKEENKKLHDTIMQTYEIIQKNNARAEEREQKAVEKVRQETIKEITSAQQRGDFNTYNQKLLELADIEQEKLKNADLKKTEPAQPQYTNDPEIIKWLDSPNSRWFHEDPDLKTMAEFHYRNLEIKYPNITTKQRLEMTEKFVIDKNPDKFDVKKKEFTAVEGGTGVGTRSNGKSFSDIPSDDKGAMERMAKALSFYKDLDSRDPEKKADAKRKYDDYKKACVESFFGKRG